MRDRFVMALDAGSGAGRCILIDIDSQRVVSTYKEWSYTIPPGLGMMAAEFDPGQFWGILAQISHQAIQKAGISPEQIVAVSSTSQREGIVLLDENGVEIYAGPNRDYRATSEGMQITNTLGADLYRRSGHFPSGMTGAARLVWFKNHAPDLYRRIRHLQSINDWILFRLSNEYYCEPTNAAETSLYDLGAQEWSFDAIEKLEVPKEIFPKVLSAGTQIGSVTQRVAKETGLLSGTPVVIGGADTQCGLLGCGAINPFDVAAVSGTTTPIQVTISEPIVDPDQRLWGGAHIVPGKFILESNAGGSGSTYQWFRDSFYSEVVQRSKLTGENPYEIMNAEAYEAPIGSNGMQAFIGVMIMNAKTMTMPPNAILLGMNPQAAPNMCCRPLLTRAVIESFAFAVKANLQQIIDVIGVVPNAMGVCGGLAKSRLYLEVLANTLQLPIRVPIIKEGTAVGAAIAAGLGSGVFKSFKEGVTALVHIENEIYPDAHLCKQYQDIYQEWSQNLQPLLALSARI